MSRIAQIELRPGRFAGLILGLVALASVAGAQSARSVRGMDGHVRKAPLVTIDFEQTHNGELISGEIGGSSFSITGQSASGLTAAAFDSSPNGPNANGGDPDLLVGLGQVLILQGNASMAVPGTYDVPDDDAGGGAFVMTFGGAGFAPKSIDLVDFCPDAGQGAEITLRDRTARTCVYTVPAGWTEDVAVQGGAGYRTLDLTTVNDQPGFAATATAEAEVGFAFEDVLRIDIVFDGSGALDNLVYDPDPLFRIVACSLGCHSSGTGQLGCDEADIHVNEVLGVTFNKPVDLASVSPAAVQIVASATGQSVPGVFGVDPLDPRRLLFTPQLAFDSAGNPVFGFEEDEIYRFVIPGAALDPLGPWVRSLGGDANTTRLSCILLTTLGVQDAVPGRPSVSVTVDVVTGYDPVTGLPSSIAPGVPAQGATQVFSETDITLSFDDLMNPASLINPVLGTSATVRVLADPDGDLSDPSDQFAIAGTFDLVLNTLAPETRLVFDPQDSLPPAGSAPGQLVIVVDISPDIFDLAGNALINPGVVVFVPEE